MTVSPWKLPIRWRLVQRPEWVDFGPTRTERCGLLCYCNVGPGLFRFVGCLPLTTDMSAGHKRMRAGVVQIPMEETAECSGVAGTFSAMGIEEVGCGVGLTQRWGKAG